jgi:hypothetical protein
MNHPALPDDVDAPLWCAPPTQSSTTTSVASTDDELPRVDGLDGSGWWNGLRETASGVVRFVQHSARTLASELAALEFAPPEGDDALHLPWEIHDPSGRYIADPILKEKIFQLSHEERTFTYSRNRDYAAYDNDDDEEAEAPFALTAARVELIHRLLALDPQLAQRHTQYSGRTTWRESAFWSSYFSACQATRRDHVEEGDPLEEEARNRSSSFPESPSEEEEEGDPLEEEDDDDAASSFVCVPRAPNSCLSTGMRSVGSLVLVEVPGSGGPSDGCL